MFKKGFLFLVTICVAAEASTFTDTLLKNVNRYKQNNFQWNVRNVGDNNYISLRKIEEEKDREFNEYLQQLRKPVYDSALDVVETIQYRDNIQVHDKTDGSLLERHALPRIMRYANKTRSLNSLFVHTKRQQHKEQRDHINAMMYSGKLNIPERMCYFCKNNFPLEQDMMSKRESSDYPRSMQIMFYNALEDAPQTMMYNALEDAPQTMMYSNKDRAIEQPGNVMMYAGNSQPQDMMYKRESGDNARSMQVMMYNALEDAPQIMMYNALEDAPQTMMYNALEDAPQTMMYSNKDRAIEQPANVMMYAGSSQPQDMMYKRESGNNARSMQVMMYNALEDTPQTMMYNALEDAPQTMMYNALEDAPQIMMYNALEDAPQTMMYNALEDAPQTMMYSNKDRAIEQPGNVMMYAGSSQPQDMMYKRESGNNARSMRVMMYNALEDAPQTMMYNALEDAPQTMMYNALEDAPQTMMYNALEDAPQTMMYSNKDRAIEQPGNVMMYAGSSQPQDMMYKRESGNNARSMQVMMHNALEDAPQTMMYNALEDAPQTMMYSNKDRAIEQPRNVMMYAGSSQPQDMMYKRESGDYPQPMQVMKYNTMVDTPQTMMYNALEDTPLTLMYSNKDRAIEQPGNVMMYAGTSQPQDMMYKRESGNSVRSMQVMMYNALEDTPQTMMYNALEDAPQTMMYNALEDAPQTMMYNALEDTPLTLMYSNKDRAIEQPGNVMMYAGSSQPQDMMYKRESGNNARSMQVMMYNALEDAPQTMMYNALEDAPQTMMYSNKDRAIEQPGNVMMYAGSSQPQDMMYKRESGNNARSMQVMMHNALEDAPQTMMYNALEDAPQTMMYNALEDAPQTMMYSNKDRAIEQPGNMMMYAGSSQPQDMMYKRESGNNARSMQVMMYNALEDTPQTMMYSNKDRAIEQPGNMMMYAGSSQPQDMMYKRESGNNARSMQVMMYNALEDTPQTMMYNALEDAPQTMMYNALEDAPQTMMYNALEDAPQTMMYSNKDRAIEQPRNVMMYAGKSQPQDMMYKRESGNNVRSMQVMMYNALEDTPQTMMHTLEDAPQTMMYNALEDAPQTMMYSNKDRAIEQPGNVMMYAGSSQPQDMMYKRESGSYPQPMMYNGLKETPQTMLYGNTRDLNGERRNIISYQGNKQTQYLDSKDNHIMFAPNKLYDRYRWYKPVSSLANNVPKSDETYFNQWTETIAIFGTNQTARSQFKKTFPVLSVDKVINNLATVTVFEKLFWPFVYENGFMNQKLGLLGLSGVSTPVQDQKIAFYEALERQQTLKIPVSPNKVVLSFNDRDVVDGLNRSGLMETRKQYVDAGLHLYTPEEEMVISRRVNAALHLINATMPQLYKAISQVVACIAYYKAQHPGFAGGSISSALGLIWQDPRVYTEQSVAHYAEQIVHEFIHNSLFLADMVHGTFVNSKLTSQAKVYSPIRHELRDFDKTFHASYVSTGVALFHARAGNFEKAKKLLEPLETSVTGLVEINNEVGVLNESGNAMLQAMVDFLYVIRLM